MNLLIGLFIFLLIMGVMALEALAATWAWNVIAPLFHGPVITLYQAVAGIVLLNVIGGCLKWLFGKRSDASS